MTTYYYPEQLRAVHAGRPWILALDVLAAAPRHIAELEAVGVHRMLVLAGSRGTGPVPDDVPAVVLDVSGPTLMEAIRAIDDAMGDLDPGARAAVDAFDPDGAAKVIGTPLTQLSTIADRAIWGARPQTWQVLEDKTTVDAIWQAAGVPQAPSVIVPAETDALRSAAAALDTGAGTVWVADNREGWHGGATGLRLVTSDEHALEAAAHLGEHADQVRVMPFLEGVPCSIHGMVLPDSTIAFRPCEMLVLRRPGRSDLCYAGMASLWDPPASDRDELRAHARRVGEHLRAAVGYRGVFTIDGIMTVDGFRPTELNPRYGAALGMLGAAASVPLYLVHLAVVEDVDVDWRPDELERLVIGGAHRVRMVRSHLMVDAELPEGSIWLRREGSRLVAVDDEAEADLALQRGPAPAGSLVRVEIDDDVVPTGSSPASLVAAALAWADDHWGLGLGPLQPASDVRR